MASTNETTNYDLSQFVGTDKPAWLTDYNQDMNKIDTAIKSVSDTATAADGKADANATKIGTLSYLSTSDKSSLVAAINEVDGNTDTAQNTANQAYNLAFNLLSLDNISTCNTSISANLSSISEATFKCATNSSKTVFKVYGQARLDAPAGTTNASVTLTNTGLDSRTESYNIECGALGFRDLDGSTVVLNLTVNTDGSITISGINFGNNNAMRLYIAPSLFIDSDFGD